MKFGFLTGLSILLAGIFAVQLHAQPAPPAGDAPTTQPGVTLINIHMKGALPEDIFTELAKQGGVKFNNNGNLWEQDAMQTPVDVDITDKPFWPAMRQVCSLTGVSPQPNYGMNNGSAKRIQLDHFQGIQEHDWDSLPTVETPSVMVQARSFNRQQNVDYGKQQGNMPNYCSLQLFVYIDPSLPLQSFNQNVKADEAVDDAGNSMLPESKNQMFFGGMQQMRSLIYQCQVPLRYPENAGKKIAHIKFTLNMRAGTKMESLSVEKPLEAAESTKVFGDTTIVFESAKKSDAGYEVKVGVARDQNGGNDWGMLQTAQLLDEKGRPFGYRGGGGGGSGDNGVTEYTINYGNNGNGNGSDSAGASAVPAKWVIEMATETHAVKVPVEFKDLRLP